MHRVGCGHVELWAWNVPRRGKVDLPESLLDYAVFRGISGNLCRHSELLYIGKTFAVALGTVINLRELGIHSICLKKALIGSQKPKGGVTKSKRARPHKNELALFLQLDWSVKVRKLTGREESNNNNTCALFV